MLTVVEVVNLSKKFRIYQDRAQTLKESLIFWNRQKVEEFWALKDVNLTVSGGTTVGLIGRNGSGKSTLLKMISRILYPTEGTVKINGRVSTLLELGAGFHPDFTGRENIFLNASILGLSRKDTERRLDDIIEFAELEEFIDNPVRNYSSGMYMRLGFSVAVHVDPDILLVDEVMAVGDVAFQKKCQEKINEFRRNGKTIIFVTHDMSLVQRICDHAVWLENGLVVASGEANEVINKYLDLMATRDMERMMREKQRTNLQEENEAAGADSKVDTITDDIKQSNVDKPNRWGNRQVEIKEARMLNHQGKECYSFECGQAANIIMRYTMRKELTDLTFGIGVFRDDNLHCYGTNMLIDQYEIERFPAGGIVECKVKSLHLLEGRYFVDIAVHSKDGIPYDYWTKCMEFTVFSRVRDVGVSRLDHSWKVHELTEGMGNA